LLERTVPSFSATLPLKNDKLIISKIRLVVN